MKNYTLFLLILIFLFSCKKSNKATGNNPPSEIKISFQVDSISTQPGLFLTLKASSRITKDTLTTMIGGKSILLFKIDSIHYAFWVPVIPAGTYPLDLRGVNAENMPEVVIRNYVPITNTDAMIAEVTTDYNRLADSLERNSFFNKNATRHAAVIRQLLLQVNQNLATLTLEDRKLLAYLFQFNRPDLTPFRSQLIDTNYLVSRAVDNSLDISQQALDNLTQFEAKKIHAIYQAKKVVMIFAAMYFAIPNPLLLAALSVGAIIETAHFLSLMDEATELSTKSMTTAFKAFDSMQEENGNGTISNAILANSSVPIWFRYIVRFKTLEKSDGASPIQIIATAIKAAYELEENGRSIKSTFESAKSKFTVLFDKIDISFTPFVSPVLNTAKEKLASINSRFISVTNVSNPDIVVTAVDDGTRGLKLNFSNPTNNIRTQTNFSFQLSYNQTTINNTVITVQQAKFIPLALPTVTTSTVGLITETTASSGGIITNDGGGTIISKGVCWSTSPNPTIANSKTNDGPGNGSFISSITSLIQNTMYYVRAYATNGAGTAYGNEFSFSTTKSTTLSGSGWRNYDIICFTTNSTTMSPSCLNQYPIEMFITVNSSQASGTFRRGGTDILRPISGSLTSTDMDLISTSIDTTYFVNNGPIAEIAIKTFTFKGTSVGNNVYTGVHTENSQITYFYAGLPPANITSSGHFQITLR